MAVDLAEHIEALRAKVNPPGQDLYPDATSADWVLRLSNAFWDGYLHKMFQGYRENEGTVRPVTAGGPDLPRDQVQLVILYAALNCLLTRMSDLKTQFSASAGPTKFEYQRAASVLAALIKDARAELNEVVKDLGRKGVTATYFRDAVDMRLSVDDVIWVR